MRGSRAIAGFVVACAVTAAPASAGTSEFATFFVQFKFSQGEFAGKIDSSKGDCVKNRKIVLYRKKSGNKKKLGSDETNNKGKFKIGVGGDPKNGKYFAQANSKSIGGGTCRSETSAKVEIS